MELLRVITLLLRLEIAGLPANAVDWALGLSQPTEEELSWLHWDLAARHSYPVGEVVRDPQELLLLWANAWITAKIAPSARGLGGNLRPRLEPGGQK